MFWASLHQMKPLNYSVLVNIGEDFGRYGLVRESNRIRKCLVDEPAQLDADGEADGDEGGEHGRQSGAH
jgi:hypothetical protein